MNNTIQDAYISMYAIITEAINPALHEIMNSDSIPIRSKNAMVAKKAREMIAAGEETGLVDGKPKKGSSRAVYFPKEPKKITLDGKETSTPTALKIAFPGVLDRYHREPTLLGEDQNRVESDHYIHHEYGVFHQTSDNTFESCRHESGGILAPVLDTHPDNHYLEMGKITPITAASVAEATKTPEFPSGLKFSHITDALRHERAIAHGQRHHGSLTDEQLDQIKQHPWVDHAISMIHETGMHPDDMRAANVGIFTHSVTGKKHLVLCDFGYDNSIAAKYTKARRNIPRAY